MRLNEKVTITKRIIETILVFFMLTAVMAEAESGRMYVDMSGGYKTGTFGSPVRSDLFYFVPAMGYLSQRYDLTISIPYLFLSNNSGNTDALGSVNGFGDIVLRADRVVVMEGTRGFSLDGAIAIKLPTADDAQGLGSGKTDIGAFVNAHQLVGKFKIFLLSGFIKVGQPTNVTYNNIYLYGIGVSRLFGFTNVYVSFEGRRAIIPGNQNPQEMHCGIFHAINKDYSCKAGAFVGLNNGGPAFGADIGIERWF